MFKTYIFRLVLFVLGLFVGLNIIAQPLGKVLPGKQNELIEFGKQSSQKWYLEKRRADSLAKILDLPISYIDTNGRVIILQQLGKHNKPIYYATNNINAAAIINVNQVWTDANNLPYLTGKDVVINVWDGGAILESHQEFQSEEFSRIKMRNVNIGLSDHSTHVAGTMAAAGIDENAKGMAGQAFIYGWDFNNDIAEMAIMAAEDIMVSNHSYGSLCGWFYSSITESWYWYGDTELSEVEDAEFGFYNQTSADLDYLAWCAPNYLIVKSAGNDRGAGPASQPVMHNVWDGAWVSVNDVVRDADGGIDGYDCLTPMSVAKNIITIGAVDDAELLTPFSAFGPTDDGRIKPDVMTNGADVYSSIASSINDYGAYNGTSMAAASATGAIALLNHLQNKLQPGVNLWSSTVKGLIIHTAEDMGDKAGPDYQTGWGLMDIKKAADLMVESYSSGGQSIIQETITQGETLIFPVEVTDAPFLKVTLCWTDPPGQPLAASLNQHESKLVNDLNLQTVGSNNTTIYLPYVLDVLNPDNLAISGVNHVDNVEQVYIVNPNAGTFNIEVYHTGTLAGEKQAFSLIVSGIETSSNILPPHHLIAQTYPTQIKLQWSAPELSTPLAYKIYRNNVMIAQVEDSFFYDINVVSDTTYKYCVSAIYLTNNTEVESLFTNEVVVCKREWRELPVSIDFETEPTEILISNTINGWRWGDSDSLSCYYLNFESNETKFIAIDSYSTGKVSHVTDIATTMPLKLAEYTDVKISFQYKFITGIYDAIDELHLVYKLQDEDEWHGWDTLPAAFSWTESTLLLPEDAYKNGTQIGFYYDDFYQPGMGAGIDDIVISGIPNQVTDFAIKAMVNPVSVCNVPGPVPVSILISNNGEQIITPNQVLYIDMVVSNGLVVNDSFLLTDTLYPEDSFTYTMSSSVNLSDVGVYDFEFTIASEFDFNEENNQLTSEIDVFALPQAQILNTQLTFCETDLPVPIEVSPEGGVLSGTGLIGLNFYPEVAGVGVHTLQYTFVDENGCENMAQQIFTVFALPKPQILNTQLTFCETDLPVPIEVSPEGGVLSGTGVIGLNFYPEVAGVGVHTLQYTFVDENGCEAIASKDFTVIVSSEPHFLGNQVTFCENDSPVLIEVYPEGGTISGSGIFDSFFDPQQAGVGIHTIVYTYINENGCVDSILEDLTVFALPEPEILNLQNTFCLNDSPILIDVSPEGGSIFGAGVSESLFIPFDAGVGNHAITYVYMDENGCKDSTAVEFYVWPLPQLEILNTQQIFCEIDTLIQIQACPEGGVLSGAGVVDNYFNPVLAGLGDHTLVYSYTDNNSCEGNLSIDFTVKPLPQPEILNTQYSFCENEPPVKVEVWPEGGMLFGPGISDQYFNPEIAGAGIHVISYLYTDEYSCEAVITAEFNVMSLPQPQILTNQVSFCIDEPPILIQVSPEGGVLSGIGVSGNLFNPAEAGIGEHIINYTYTNNDGCVGEVTLEVSVTDVPKIQNEQLKFCENEPPAYIEVIPVGGIISGPGVEGEYFYPQIAGVGTHTIFYDYAMNNECQEIVSQEFVVLAVPKPEILNEKTQFCINEPAVLIEVNFDGGTLSGSGISGFYFSPQDAGEGNHTVSYSYCDDNGCEGVDIKDFTVLNIPQSEIINPQLSFCIDDPSVLMQVYPEGGVLSGNGVSGLYFNPQLAGEGIHELTYTFVDENGCEGSESINVSVVISPQITLLDNDTSFCLNALPVLLQVSPEGGVLTGPGISGLYFNPLEAGAGIHTIVYNYDQDNVCGGITTKEIRVTALPQPEIQNENLSFCLYEPPVLIQVNPPGGILTGSGVDGFYFNPIDAGTGRHALTYSFVDENGCEGIVTEEVSVEAIPQLEILGANPSVCENESPFLIDVCPVGGILSGPGIIEMYFYPNVAGTGVHSVTYTFTNENGCQDSISEKITVTAIPEPEIRNEKLVFCENDSPVLIDVYPEGGTLTGPGITEMVLYPNELELGVHKIMYTYTDSNGCEGFVENAIEVIEAPVIYIGDDKTIRINDTIILRIDNDDYTFLWHDGSIEDSLIIIASELGIGSHTIILEVTDGNYCSNVDSLQVTVIKENEVFLQAVSSALIIPNPFSQYFYLQIDEKEKLLNVDLFDCSGRLFLNSIPATYPYFYVPYLLPGYYILKIQTGNGEFVLRLVKL